MHNVRALPTGRLSSTRACAERARAKGGAPCRRPQARSSTAIRLHALATAQGALARLRPTSNKSFPGVPSAVSPASRGPALRLRVGGLQLPPSAPRVFARRPTRGITGAQCALDWDNKRVVVVVPIRKRLSSSQLLAGIRCDAGLVLDEPVRPLLKYRLYKNNLPHPWRCGWGVRKVILVHAYETYMLPGQTSTLVQKDHQ
jgi:hypothetical protein